MNTIPVCTKSTIVQTQREADHNPALLIPHQDKVPSSVYLAFIVSEKSLGIIELSSSVRLRLIIVPKLIYVNVFNDRALLNVI